MFAPGLLAGSLFALEYMLLGAMLLEGHVSAAFLLGAALVLAAIVLLSASGPLPLLFAARRKQGRVAL